MGLGEPLVDPGLLAVEGGKPPLQPALQALNDAATELNLEAGNPAEAIDQLEGAVARRSLYDRVPEKCSQASRRRLPVKIT